MKKLLILLFLTAIFTGCYKLSSGIVIKKYFVAAHNDVFTTIVSSGKPAVPVIRTQYVPDKWFIVIEGKYRGRTVQEARSISEADFENVNIGDFVECGKVFINITTRNIKKGN